MTIEHTLPFEKPIIELEAKYEELRSLAESHELDLTKELTRLSQTISQTRQRIFSNLTSWEKVQLARHPQRPYTLDYIDAIFTDFIELHGDRHFADDRAIVGGLARLDAQKVMVIGLQKGRDVKSNVKRNFGMAHPEGYRKALRLMKMAARFKLPIVTLIDTAGAFPGIGGEERHVAEAIAMNLREAIMLPVPIIVVVIGEGGSGGALGIGVGDRILIMEHAYYSVISPEGCAAILWKDRAYASQAAEMLHLTAQSLLKDKLVDEIIAEPEGGAHRAPEAAAAELKKCLLTNLQQLTKLSTEKLLQQRYLKFRTMGVFHEDKQTTPVNDSPAAT